MGLIFNFLKNVLPQSTIDNFIIRKTIINYNKHSEQLEKSWKENPTGEAPHKVKQETIKKLASENNINTFVETGIFLGKMIEAMIPHFKKIYSIELSKPLYDRAVNLFKNNKNVELLLGDSGVKITEVLTKLNEPAIFWLDGHYSGGITAMTEIETPIMAEIRNILSHPVKNHIIVIDDARLFIGTRDYPTIEEVEKLVYSFDHNLKVMVLHDFIIIKN